MVASEIESGGNEPSSNPLAKAAEIDQRKTAEAAILDQARGVVEVRAAEQPIHDTQALDRAFRTAVDVAQSLGNKRSYLRRILEYPELDLLPRERPPLESIRRRNDLDLLFRAKAALTYAKYRFPENILKRTILERIVYNYLCQQRDLQAAASELIDDPTSEIATLDYQIESAKHNNYRTVLGAKHLRDLDEIEAIYQHLQRNGAEPDLDRLPTLAKLEQRFQRTRAAASGTAEGGVPAPGPQITTEADINRLLSVVLKQARARSRSEQPASDNSEPLVTSDELDDLLSNMLEHRNEHRP